MKYEDNNSHIYCRQWVKWEGDDKRDSPQRSYRTWNLLKPAFSYKPCVMFSQLLRTSASGMMKIQYAPFAHLQQIRSTYCSGRKTSLTQDCYVRWQNYLAATLEARSPLQSPHAFKACTSHIEVRQVGAAWNWKLNGPEALLPSGDHR